MIDVSVLLVTYNHAPFIERAVESVLAQQTSRSFELIISEDCSTDGTRETVEKAAANDGRIRTLLSAQNLGANKPVMRAIHAARGPYICLLDGDDHWLVPDKIDRQAKLLDDHPDVTGCFHNALVVYGDASEPSERRWTPSTQPPRISFREIWEGNPFPTCGGMLRRSALEHLGDWYVDSIPKLFTDWPLYVVCAERGDLMFIDEPVGAYRVHEGGEFSGLTRKDKLLQIASFYRQMSRVEEGRWADMARRGASLYFLGEAGRFLGEGDQAMARLCARLAFQAGGVGQSVPWRDWLGLWRRSLV